MWDDYDYNYYGYVSLNRQCNGCVFEFFAVQWDQGTAQPCQIQMCNFYDCPCNDIKGCQARILKNEKQ